MSQYWFEQRKPGDQMTQLNTTDKLVKALSALDELACWNHTGNISRCDEPGAVQLAREVLRKIRWGRFRDELPEGQKKPEQRGEANLDKKK